MFHAEDVPRNVALTVLSCGCGSVEVVADDVKCTVTPNIPYRGYKINDVLTLIDDEDLVLSLASALVWVLSGEGEDKQQFDVWVTKDGLGRIAPERFSYGATKVIHTSNGYRVVREGLQFHIPDRNERTLDYAISAAKVVETILGGDDKHERTK